jgi:transposase-like protein
MKDLGVQYIYCCSNEYNYNKALAYVQSKGASYQSYGFNLVTTVSIPFSGKYYINQIGKTNGSVLTNNITYPEFYSCNIIFNKFGRLTKKKDGLALYVAKKKYKMNYSIDILRYFYDREKVFFEKEYEVDYLGDIISKDNEHNFKLKQVFKCEGDSYNFEVFDKEYFSQLTKRQKQIFTLYTLDIRVTDIARMIKTSQAYISLEIKRIIKKLTKLKCKYADKVVEVVKPNVANEVEDVFQQEVDMKQEVLI